VRYVRSSYIAAEETAFHVFDASDERAVAEAMREAGLEPDRITAVVELAGHEPTRRWEP